MFSLHWYKTVALQDSSPSIFPPEPSTCWASWSSAEELLVTKGSVTHWVSVILPSWLFIPLPSTQPYTYTHSLRSKQHHMQTVQCRYSYLTQAFNPFFFLVNDHLRSCNLTNAAFTWQQHFRLSPAPLTSVLPCAITAAVMLLLPVTQAVHWVTASLIRYALPRALLSFAVLLPRLTPH